MSQVSLTTCNLYKLCIWKYCLISHNLLNIDLFTFIFLSCITSTYTKGCNLKHTPKSHKLGSEWHKHKPYKHISIHIQVYIVYMKYVIEISLIMKLWHGFKIKRLSYQCRKSNYWDRMVVRQSFLHNNDSYTGKMLSIYWNNNSTVHTCISGWTAVLVVNYGISNTVVLEIP